MKITYLKKFFNFDYYFQSYPFSWWLSLFAFLLPIFFFLISIAWIGVDVPYSDDIDAIFAFLKDWHSASGLGKISILFAQHNEHRIVVSRLIIICWQGIFKSLWLPGLMLLGGGMLVGLFGLIFRVFSIRNKIYWLWPLSWFFFVPQYSEATYWAMAAISNFGVIFFVASTLWLLHKKEGWWWVCTALMAILATFSNGNGIMMFPAGIFILLVQRRWIALSWWVGIMMICVGGYFYNYVFLSDQHNLLMVLSRPLLFICYFLALIGGAFASFFVDALFSSVLAGGLAFGAIGWLIYKKYYLVNPWGMGMILFILLSALSTTLVRSGLGVDYAISSRYRINSIIIFTILFGAYFELYRKFFQRKLIYITCVIMMIVYTFFSYIARWPYLIAQEDQLLQNVRRTPSEFVYPIKDRARSIMDYAVSQGWWNVP